MNVIKFAGIHQKNNYLAYRVYKDKYIALGKDNVLYTWSLVSGKLLYQHRLSDNYDYSQYKRVEDDEGDVKMRSKVLLQSKYKVEDQKIEDYL